MTNNSIVFFWKSATSFASFSNIISFQIFFDKFLYIKHSETNANFMASDARRYDTASSIQQYPKLYAYVRENDSMNLIQFFMEKNFTVHLSSTAFHEPIYVVSNGCFFTMYAHWLNSFAQGGSILAKNRLTWRHDRSNFWIHWLHQYPAAIFFCFRHRVSTTSLLLA